MSVRNFPLCPLPARPQYCYCPRRLVLPLCRRNRPAVFRIYHRQGAAVFLCPAAFVLYCHYRKSAPGQRGYCCPYPLAPRKNQRRYFFQTLFGYPAPRPGYCNHPLLSAVMIRPAAVPPFFAVCPNQPAFAPLWYASDTGGFSVPLFALVAQTLEYPPCFPAGRCLRALKNPLVFAPNVRH